MAKKTIQAGVFVPILVSMEIVLVSLSLIPSYPLNFAGIIVHYGFPFTFLIEYSIGVSPGVHFTTIFEAVYFVIDLLFYMIIPLATIIAVKILANTHQGN